MKQQQSQYEADIRLNKVKEGFLIKRSRILKQWKQRWMVLTKSHLYSFVQKQVYKDPTQKIPLKQVSTIKSYYKNQYSRKEVIRIQSTDTQFYLSAKNHQQKWSWMTAIEKMTDVAICGHEQSCQSVNMIRQTLRMTTAIRKTLNLQNQIGKPATSNNINTEIPNDLLAKLKLSINSNTASAIVLPTINIKQLQIQQTSQNRTQKQQQPLASKISSNGTNNQKIVEKIIYVPEIKQKIVYVPEIVEKIVYVPEIKEINAPTTSQIIQKENIRKYDQNKIKNNHNNSINNTKTNETQLNTLLQFFQQVMHLKCENPKPLIEFIVFLMFSQPQKYTNLVLSFVTLQSTQHAFSNAFLQVINQETDESKLNGYLQLIMVLYENYEEYFYRNDLKLLIEILTREIEMNRSNLNQFLIIGVLNAMVGKSWWKSVSHRREELIGVVSDVKAWTNDIQMRFAAQQLLEKI